MAATHTLTGNLFDLARLPLGAQNVRPVAVTNLPPSEALVDRTTNGIHLGGKPVTLNESTGQMSIDLIDTSATDLNVVANTLEYEIRAAYIDPANNVERTWQSGWFPLTADRNLADIATDVSPMAVQSASGFALEAKAARDEALTALDGALADVVDISGIAVPDATVEALVKGTAGAGEKTRAALSATFAMGSALAGRTANARLWQPPTQPAGPDLATWNGPKILSDLWEPLRAADPAYVSRQVIGQSVGTPTGDIYAYTFAPPTYGNTIVLFNLHGGEKITMYAAAKFMDRMVNNWKTDPALAALRASTRIVIVPFTSYYGVNGNTRKNANGVDLARNWDYKWSAFASAPADTTYKGTAPFSEPETQALRDLILSLEAQGGLVAALDLHDVGAATAPSGYHFYANLPDKAMDSKGGSWLRELADSIAKVQGVTSPKIGLTLTDAPQAFNWIQNRGIWSTSIEFEQRWGTTGMDSANQTACLRWIGNAMLKAASLPSIPTTKPEPFSRQFTFSSGSSSIQVTTASPAQQEVQEFRWEFYPPCAGIVMFQGSLIVGTPTAPVGRINVFPSIGQTGTSYTQGATYAGDTNFTDTANSTDRKTLTFSITRPVVEDYFPTRVTLFMNGESGAQPYIYRYSASLLFIPANGGKRFELMTATGRGGQGAGAMQTLSGV